MTVSSGQKINAYEFNLLQNRVDNILGNGFGDQGYGQEISSSRVNPPSNPNAEDSDIITANQFNNLRNDIDRIFKHQTGQPLPIPVIVDTDIVGAEQTAKSITIDGNNVVLDGDTSEPLKGFNNFISQLDNLETNRFRIAQSETDVLFTDGRETSFNGAVSSEFRFNFLSSDARRHFFNAGGQIKIEGNATNLGSSGDNSYDRNDFWDGLITEPNEIVFGYNYTKLPSENMDGVTLASAVGNYQLNKNYQIIFKKQGSSNVYADSYWQIEAKSENDSSIDFKITLVDIGPGNDPVTADIDFSIEGRRAAGAVETEYPVYQIVSSFED